MSNGKNDGDKTELPSAKKLRDARKRGDVAKSKDVGAAVVTFGWLILFMIASSFIATRIAVFAQDAVAQAVAGDFDLALGALGWDAIGLVILMVGAFLVPMALLGTFAEFMQVGPIMTSEKMSPKLDSMNPVEGLKKMFGKDGLVEMVKTLIKAALVIVLTWIVIESLVPQLGDLIGLARWSPVDGTGPTAAEYSISLVYSVTLQLLGSVAVVFLFVAYADRLWVKHSFTKKMMMSRRDLKQEHKQDEGDPHQKSHRRQLHQEWSSSNALGAVGGSSALLVNPTHISIAIDYDAERAPVPVIAAKGEGPLAAAMRAEAERCGVPIVRNVAAARQLWSRGEVGEIVPEDMFDAIAEVILWARRAREGQSPMMTDLDNVANNGGNRGQASARPSASASALAGQ